MHNTEQGVQENQWKHDLCWSVMLSTRKSFGCTGRKTKKDIDVHADEGDVCILPCQDIQRVGAVDMDLVQKAGHLLRGKFGKGGHKVLRVGHCIESVFADRVVPPGTLDVAQISGHNRGTTSLDVGWSKTEMICQHEASRDFYKASSINFLKFVSKSNTQPPRF